MFFREAIQLICVKLQSRMKVKYIVVLVLASCIVACSNWQKDEPSKPIEVETTQPDTSNVLFQQEPYKPDAPIGFSHKLHAGTLEVDCQKCHTRNKSINYNACLTCHKEGDVDGFKKR